MGVAAVEVAHLDQVVGQGLGGAVVEHDDDGAVQDAHHGLVPGAVLVDGQGRVTVDAVACL